MPDFKALLSTPVEETERPKPVPTGNYLFQIKSHEFVESGKKKTPGVEFRATAVEPLDDVDQELLGQVKNWQNKEFRVTFWLTEDAMFMLKDFLEKHCGLNCSGRTYAEVIAAESQGAQFVGTVAHQQSTRNKEVVFAIIESTAAAA